MAEGSPMKSNSLPVMIILFLAFLSTSKMNAQSQSLATRNLDSLATLYNIGISKLTSPELEARKQVRLEMQRKCYTDALMDALANDGLSSAISYLKGKLHIEYSISHRPLIVQFPIPGGEGKTWPVALQDDWTFPANPWKK